MRQVKYTDSSPTRELEDEDWEATGQEEMNSLFENRKRSSIIHVRDRLNNIQDLVKVCAESLENSKRIDIKEIVSSVLYFYVENELTIANEELAGK